MSGAKTRTLNVPGIPAPLFNFLTELKEPYGTWKAWLANIQKDLRKARDEVDFHRTRAEFYKKQLEEAKRRLFRLQKDAGQVTVEEVEELTSLHSIDELTGTEVYVDEKGEPRPKYEEVPE